LNNDQYLVVSYFIFGAVSLSLGVMTYRILCEPFGRIVEATFRNSQSRFLKRALPIIFTLAATVGFLGISYTQHSCMSYKQVVKRRSYLEKTNREQLENTGRWLNATVIATSAGVLFCLVASRRKKSD
jgi:hypothetical protein